MGSLKTEKWESKKIKVYFNSKHNRIKTKKILFRFKV